MPSQPHRVTSEQGSDDNYHDDCSVTTLTMTHIRICWQLRKERKRRKSFRGWWLWLKTAESLSHHINTLNKYDWGTLHTYVYDKDHIHPHDSNPREGDRNLRERWQKHEGEVIVINLKERLRPGCGCPCSAWSHPPLHQSLPSGNPSCSLSHRRKWRGLQTQWMVCMIPSFGDYCLSTALLLYQ